MDKSFEVLDNFFGYGSFPTFHNIVQSKRLLTLSEPKISLNNGEIFVDIISQKHPYGYIFYKENDETQFEKSMLGLSILRDDKSFTVAFVSEHVFIYPILLACRILQEALRVGKKFIFIQQMMQYVYHGEKRMY